ncbi:hypothetical protein [Pseudoroseicyclus sp. CXY001]|uniref:hypothetical protein n=1 Tax=Pseudoroseicyclus sp. CXY001 TaxID=3242492 RepID=UPI003570B035
MLADIEMAVTGLKSNELEQDERFYWMTTDFRLNSPAFGDLPLVGERFMSELMDRQFNGVSVGETALRRMVYLVPEGLPGVELMYGDEVVAEVVFRGGGVGGQDVVFCRFSLATFRAMAARFDMSPLVGVTCNSP